MRQLYREGFSRSSSGRNEEVIPRGVFLFSDSLIICIPGLLVGEMRQLYREGFSAYSGSIYNHFDFVMLVLYITSFVLHIVVETEVNLGDW